MFCADQEFSHDLLWRKLCFKGLLRHSSRVSGCRRKGRLPGSPPGKIFSSRLEGCLPDPLEDHVQKFPSVRMEVSIIPHDFFRTEVFLEGVRFKSEEIYQY